jgi:hypothetical protein
MKYKLLKELPFLKADSIFGMGCWVGGGFGVDRGTAQYSGGGSSHNGIRVFDDYENDLLQKLVDRKWPGSWVVLVPESSLEVLELFKKGEIEPMEAIDKIITIERGGNRYDKLMSDKLEKEEINE